MQSKYTNHCGFSCKTIKSRDVRFPDSLGASAKKVYKKCASDTSWHFVWDIPPWFQFEANVYTHWPLYLVHLASTRVGSLFAFKNALILRGIVSTRCWKRSSDILVHIDMIVSHSCCRFVGCTSMMWISRSTTSQKCSVGLRSGDCGGHLSKVNSLTVAFKQCSIGTKGPKVCQENIPHTLHHHHHQGGGGYLQNVYLQKCK